MKKLTTKKHLGFTLIELLMVIAIIGILAAVVLIAQGRSKMQARDARRLADVKEIYNALNVYYTNTDSFPPDCITAGYAGGCDVVDVPEPGIDSDSSQDGQFVPFLIPDFMGTVPSDPINDATYHYTYTTDIEYPAGSGDIYAFIVGAYLEDESSNSGGITPPVGLENFYVVGEKY